MRDEDVRGDRQPEFTQLDYEMSFVNQEDVLSFTEPMFIELVQKLFPEKTISQIPFPRITYKESIEKYGSDKPDMRKDKNNPNELAFAWIVDFPMFEKTSDGNIQAAHHPFCSIKDNRSIINMTLDIKKLRKTYLKILMKDNITKKLIEKYGKLSQYPFGMTRYLKVPIIKNGKPTINNFKKKSNG